MNNTVLQSLNQGTSATAFFIYLPLFLTVLIFTTKFKKPKLKLPPSPPKLPFIGNLHQVHGSPHHALQALAQKHGPLMLLRLGSIPTLVVSSSSLARDVMKTYDHVFPSRPELIFPKRLSYDKDVAFAPYGEYWRQMRKICVVQLLNTKKVQSFRSSRVAEIGLMLEKIEHACLSNELVNVSVMLISFTNNNVCKIAFGRKYNEGKRGSRFRKIMKEFTFLLGVFNIGDLIPSFAWMNNLNGLNSRLEKNFRDIDSFLDEVVEEHIEKRKTAMDNDDGERESEEEDFVDVLLGVEKDCSLGISFTRESTKAMVLDMFAGGTDSTSVVMEWAMSELIRNPEVMREVQKEVREIGKGKLVIEEVDTENMHYLKAVIKETLRMHPPLPLLVARESLEHVTLHGYDIPAKTRVLINVFSIGRDPKLWDDPEKFWPRRFLLNGSSASIDFRGQDFQLIPFGAGRRGCPGISFAMSVAELALANLLNRFDWALPEGIEANDMDMKEGSGITAYRKTELVLSANPHY